MPKGPNAYDSNCLTVDLKDLKKPLQGLASDMDISLGWLIRKMLKDHEYLAPYLMEKKKKR